MIRDVKEGVAMVRSARRKEFLPTSNLSNISIANNQKKTVFTQLTVISGMRGKLFAPTTKERRFVFSDRRNETKEAKQRSPIVMDLRVFPIIKRTKIGYR